MNVLSLEEKRKGKVFVTYLRKIWNVGMRAGLARYRGRLTGTYEINGNKSTGIDRCGSRWTNPEGKSGQLELTFLS
jgi:hypothetical protein